MWLSDGSTSQEAPATLSVKAAIALCVVATLVFGFFPSLLLQFTNQL
jgi:hypothetical protein